MRNFSKATLSTLFFWLRIVVPSAFKFAVSIIFDMKALLSVLLGAVAIFACAIINPFGALSHDAIESFRGNAVFSVVFLLAAFGLGFVGLFVLGLIHNPSKVYYEKVNELKRLGGILVENGIEPNLRIDALNVEGRIAGIKINNLTDDTIELLNVHLVMFYLEDNDYPVPQVVNTSSQEFNEGDENARKHMIPKRGFTDIYFARADGERETFLLKTARQFPYKTNTYRVIFAIDGYVDKRPLNTALYISHVRFRTTDRPVVQLDTIEAYVKN